MEKDRYLKEYSGIEAENVSKYLEKISNLMKTQNSEDHIFVYRGEPQKYDRPCRPNIFRKGVLDKNPFFEKSLFDTMRQNRLTGEIKYLDNAIDAQHGEFTSRLLDVTYNCLIALYFAVTPYYHKPEDALDDKDGMVYLFFVDEIFSSSAQNTNDCYEAIINRDQFWFTDNIIFAKNHKFIDHTKLNNRIISQQGAFILFQGNDADDLPVCMTYGIRIPASAKKQIRSELKLLFGIHTGTVYPETVNLVRELSEKSGKINISRFSFQTELEFVLSNFKKEIDYYLDYLMYCRQENSSSYSDANILVEKVINSYRIGLIDLNTNLLKNDREGCTDEFKKTYRSVIEKYNSILEQLGRDLKQFELDDLAIDSLKIRMGD